MDAEVSSQREDPTAAEAQGFSRSVAEAPAGRGASEDRAHEVATVNVSAYGELTVARGKKWVYTSTVLSKPVNDDHLQEPLPVPASEYFPLRLIDPAAPERVLRAILAREPKATLSQAYADVGIPHGPPIGQLALFWNVTVDVDNDHQAYEADLHGRHVCLSRVRQGKPSCEALE